MTNQTSMIRQATVPLQVGDKVVSAFQYRDHVLIVTEFGDTFYLSIGDVEDPTSIRIQRI